MDVNTILLIINMVLSTIVPVISGFISRIKVSKCCGSEVIRSTEPIERELPVAARRSSGAHELTLHIPGADNHRTHEDVV